MKLGFQRGTMRMASCLLLVALWSAPQAVLAQDDLLLKQAYQSLFGTNWPKGVNSEAPAKAVQQKTQLRQRLTQTARKQLRIPYVWGGTSRRGFDCSGLIQYVYKQLNMTLPRTAAQQYRESRRVKTHELQPGDLIFFHTRLRSRSRINHVGMYLGNNSFIHAPRKGRTVSIDKLNSYWKKRMIGGGRLF
jgi:cell wall-associated NlpC family hydrolase